MSDIAKEFIDQAPKVEEKVKADADKVEDSVENRFDSLVEFLKQHGIYFKG